MTPRCVSVIDLLTGRVPSVLSVGCVYVCGGVGVQGAAVRIGDRELLLDASPQSLQVPHHTIPYRAITYPSHRRPT